MNETKKCTKCGETKPLSEFYKDKKTKDGFTSWCKECMKSSNKRWKKAHPEIILEYQKRWRKEHPLRGFIYSISHPEQARRYRKTAMGKAAMQRGAYKRKARLKNCINDLTAEQWADIKKSQNYTCLHCGRSEPEIKLTRDHIIPVSAGGHNTKSNIQGLCQSCNSRKHAKVDFTG